MRALQLYVCLCVCLCGWWWPNAGKFLAITYITDRKKVSLLSREYRLERMWMVLLLEGKERAALNHQAPKALL